MIHYNAVLAGLARKDWLRSMQVRGFQALVGQGSLGTVPHRPPGRGSQGSTAHLALSARPLALLLLGQHRLARLASAESCSMVVRAMDIGCV